MVRVLRVAEENERARADRLLIDVGGPCRPSSACPCTRRDRIDAYSIAMFWMNGALTSFSVNFTVYGSTFSIFEISLVHAEVREVRKLHVVRLTERIVRGSSMRLNVKITSSALNSRVGSKYGRRLVLHAVAQMERVGESVGRHVPLLGETRLDLRSRRASNSTMTVVHGERVRGEIGAGQCIGPDRSRPGCLRSSTRASCSGWRHSPRSLRRASP